MNARLKRVIETATTRIMLTIVSTLKRAYNMRLVPESIERIRNEVDEELNRVAIASRLDVLNPIEDTRPDQSMIDTKPYRAKGQPPPLPPPKKKDP